MLGASQTAMRAPFGQKGVAGPRSGAGWDAPTWAEVDFGVPALVGHVDDRDRDHGGRQLGEIAVEDVGGINDRGCLAFGHEN